MNIKSKKDQPLRDRVTKMRETIQSSLRIFGLDTNEDLSMFTAETLLLLPKEFISHIPYRFIV